MSSDAASPARATLVLASENTGKLKEIRSILADLPIAVQLPNRYATVHYPEEGDDYAANAAAKALAAAQVCGVPALADDSGLEVTVLGGAPGPRSARYGGPGLDDAGRVARLLATLHEVPPTERAACFVAVAALAIPDGRVVLSRGVCRGRILEQPRGRGGFGYDPIFWVEQVQASMAELPPEVKNRLSHRGRAFRGLVPEILQKVLAASEPGA